MNIIFTILLALFASVVTQSIPVEAEQPVTEEVSVAEPEPTESEPETPAEAPQSPQESVQEQKPASVPSTPLEPAQKANKWQFSSVNEFEEAFLWTCPKDVPVGVWPDKLRANVAIGILTSTIYQERGNARGETLAIWSGYRSGQVTIPVRVVSNIEDTGIHVSANSGDGYLKYRYTNGDLGSNSGWEFMINWPERRIYVDVDEEWGYVQISDKTKADADMMANHMTELLRNFEEGYIRRCGDVY